MSTERKMPRPKIGDIVIYHNSLGVPHNAVITAAWDQDGMLDQPYINLVFVSSDANKTDTYGRQIERNTSVSHVAKAGVPHGNYWRWPNEEPIEIREPSAK